MKRIVTMQDISCIGKCSLTVALPIISAMGIETAILPTAVLSTHTMFKGFTFHDLTNELEPIISHWKKEEFTFSAIYTGYLGSMEQITIAKHFIDTTEGNPLVIVDPCMADAGKLYTGFTLEFVEEMKHLCEKADIICPNITEACLLLHQPYKESFSEEEIKKMLKELCKFGSQKAIMTGVSLQENSIGAYGYDANTITYTCYFTEEETQHFHGTGDIWASTLTGCLVNGKSLQESIQIACDFVKESIHLTLQEENHNIYGVNFEQAIPSLIKQLCK